MSVAVVIGRPSTCSGAAFSGVSIRSCRRVTGTGMRQALRSEQLRDAEVEQLRCALADDEDIGRLDVAMNHQVAMRVLHRGANLHEQLEPFAHEQGAGVAIGIDGLAVDMLHHQIGRAVVEIAAVDQTRDARDDRAWRECAARCAVGCAAADAASRDAIP